ncbi:MAG: response regulator, partial [Deferribacteres bacterium]|nr:response regulator [Deferribacteres bacterium]
LSGDPNRLRQILVNLLSNAIKFTEKGEVNLLVEKEEMRDGDCRLLFSVSDTGIGIPREKQKYIFESFTQIDSSTTRRNRGTGLGLSISRRLVELMGGGIRVESEEGRGSTFYFDAKFRLCRGDGDGIQQPGRVELKGMNALVVDDNATNRLILRETLSLWGLEVTEATGGNEAIRKLRQAKETGRAFDLVLIDCKMPDMDGFEVARNIKNDRALKGTTIMMLTSEDRSNHIARAKSLGISAYVLKPVKRPELYNTIVGVLSSRKTVTARKKTTCKVEKAERPLPELPPLSILVAEDDEINQKMITRMLEKQGHRVTVAANGREALDAIEKLSFVLMDVQMPGMDGLEVTGILRERERGSGRHIPVIAITAFAFREDMERCLQAGMDGYISKPVRKEELFETISDKLSPKEARVFNEEEALRLVEGDREFLKEIAGIFIRKSFSVLQEVRDAIDSGSHEALARAAHRIKTELASFGAEPARQRAGRLEIMGRRGDMTAALQEYEALKKEISLLNEALGKFIS